MYSSLRAVLGPCFSVSLALWCTLSLLACSEQAQGSPGDGDARGDESDESDESDDSESNDETDESEQMEESHDVPRDGGDGTEPPEEPDGGPYHVGDAGMHEGPDAGARCAPDRLQLEQGWQLQSAALVSAGGADISRPGFDTAGWHDTRVPSTVLSALVADGTYPDPRVFDNHDRIPRAPFDQPWWYRLALDVPASFAGEHVELVLEGLSYRANVWLNGSLIADQSQVVGTFVTHRLDVTSKLRPGEPNVLAIEVLRGDPHRNLTITFHDWNPDAPDRGMGLWRGVSLHRTGGVVVRGAYVRTDLSDDLTSARLTVVAELENTTEREVHTRLRAELEGHTLDAEVSLGARSRGQVELTPESHAELLVHEPRVWWPRSLGDQPLYDLCVTASAGEQESDRQAVRFGVRETSSTVDAQGHRLFSFNGKPLFVRGAGYTSDILLEHKPKKRLDQELAYAFDLGLNTLRLEGKFEDHAFHDRADELGMLTLPGWMCCDRWEAWADWTAEDRSVAIRSMESQAEFLRGHPSVMGFFLASDWASPDDVADAYQAALEARGFGGSILPSATHYETHDLKSGLKMTGPYDWVPPHYWFFPHNGGAFGFLTESSPGASIPELESLRGMLTPDELDTLWRDPAAPQLHAGGRGSDFETLDEFGEALFARHGKATSLEDFVMKAQLMNYEAERVPFEAYRHNKYTRSTGFVHWLLNGAWPSLIWTLYGHDLTPSAGYFAAKKGNAPVLIQYSYGDRGIRVINDTHESLAGLHARVRVYNVDSSLRHEQESEVSVAADGVTHVATLPSLSGLSGTYFVSLTLTRSGELVNHNLYWLSTKPDVLDWARTDWRRTPSSSYGDYRALEQLAPATVASSAHSEVNGQQGLTHVVLENTGATLAFFVRLQLRRGPGGTPVLPVLWEDNYISLEPGERRELSVGYDLDALGGAMPVMEVKGYNVAADETGG